MTNHQQFIASRNDRIFGLDIFRFVAILSVIWGHASDILPKEYSTLHEKLFDVDGVTLFFVLSGFLIGSILIKTIENNIVTFKLLTRFWINRWLRTLPAYYFILSIICIINSINAGPSNFWGKFRYFLFIQNALSYRISIFDESWSLSIEEWFYLLVPIFLFVCIVVRFLNKEKAILFTVFLILIATMLIRYIKYRQMPPSNNEQWDINYRKVVMMRMDSLMFGIFGAYLSFYCQNIWLWMRKLFPVGIIAIIFLSYYHFKPETFFYSVFYLSVSSFASLLCLPYLSQIKNGTGLVYRLITYISIISYSLYLLNYSLVKNFLTINLLMGKMLPRLNLPVSSPRFIGYIFYWVALFFLSHLLYKYIELPFLGLRNRLYSKESSIRSREV